MPAAPPVPLPPVRSIECRAFDYTARDEAMAHLDAVVRASRHALRVIKSDFEARRRRCKRAAMLATVKDASRRLQPSLAGAVRGGVAAWWAAVGTKEAVRGRAKGALPGADAEADIDHTAAGRRRCCRLRSVDALPMPNAGPVTVPRSAGAPVIRMQRSADHRGRARRRQDAGNELTLLQTQYAEWLEVSPSNLQDSTLADASQTICDLDLGEPQAIGSSPRFGPDSRSPSPRATDRLEP